MKILIVDNGSKYLDKLKSLTAGHVVVIKKYSSISPLDQANFDLIILSGGHTIPVIGHEKEFAKEIALIKNSPNPILGICLGFELIAHTYGAKLKQLKAKEKSIITIGKIIRSPIFDNLDELKVYESHRWVVSDIGDELSGQARSEDGIEIIKHISKLIYGFQFHPEMFPSRTQGDELFANFIKIVENRPR